MIRSLPYLLHGRAGLVINWLQSERAGLYERRARTRIVFDARACRYVELPMAEFEQLQSDGRIEEADSRTPHLWRKQKVYRLV
ncbi:MAG: hypothetical protein IT306_01460 [Chloroflexi bacterium]|nr:hypothetical protein [Chloroflexota bacterium]